jgi:hypothetical protein
MTYTEKLISTKGLRKARFWVKQELEGEYLPSLPENVFELLFLQGRTAWNFKYYDTIEKEGKKSNKISFQITASLKREFHMFVGEHRFSFYVTCRYFPETGKIKAIKITLIE